MHLPKRFTREVLVRMAADFVMVNLAVIAAWMLRFLGTLWFGAQNIDPAVVLRESVETYLRLSPFLSVVSLGVFYLLGFYTYGRAYRSRYKALLIFQAVTLVYLILGASAYLFIHVTPWFPRSVWLMAYVFTLVLVGGLRVGSALWRKAAFSEVKIWGAPSKDEVRNVLVIGGAGYIGSVLVRKLLERGYYVTVLDALLYGDEGIRDLYGHDRFELIHDDMRNIEANVRALQFSDAVIHLGALVGDPACSLSDRLTLEINLAATRMIAEAAKGFGIRRFIFASTCSVYGASNEILNERSHLNPLSLYAKTKLQSEDLLLTLRDDQFSPVILRFATVYGLSYRPRFDLVVNLLTAKALFERKITIFGGNQWRPFIHVQDASEAILRCLEVPVYAVSGQIFNVGSDEQNYQIEEIGRLIQREIPEAEVLYQGMDSDPRNYRVSFEKIRKQLGFTPKFTVTDGIREIKRAIEGGKITDYKDPRYNNYKTLCDEHEVLAQRTTSLTPMGIEPVLLKQQFTGEKRT